jgi:hypothetical protein
MKATIADNHITIEGFRYFVGKASDVTFGAWGDKKTPIVPGALNYLDVEDVIPAPKLAEVELTVTPLTVEFADSKGINLFAGVKVPGLVNGGVGLKIGDFSSGKVTLVKISPQGESELTRQINASPKIIDKLIDFGGSARVVKTVLIAVEAELFDRFSAGLSDGGAAIVEGALVKVERSGSWESATKVTVGPNTTVAYSLAEPKWDASRDKNKTTVVDLRDDQQGW